MPEGRQMWDLQNLVAAAVLTIRREQGIRPDAEERAVVEAIAAAAPSVASTVRAVLAAADGDHEQARALLAEPWSLPRDYIWLLLVGFRADAAAASGAAGPAAELYDLLLPYADLVCGGETDAMMLGPVATRLARLAEVLGRAEEARDHWVHALAVGRRARSARWQAQAQRALQAMAAGSG
jgi:hypothetical protein